MFSKKNVPISQHSSSSSEAAASCTSTESSTISEATNSLDTQSSQVTERFMGNWAISKFLASDTGGSAYDSGTINELIGRPLIFSEEKATCFGDNIDVMNHTVSNPSYKRETLSNEELYQNYRVTFNMLGITTDSLTQISVYDNTNNGCTFFVVDNDTLILTGGGDFFQLKRNN